MTLPLTLSLYLSISLSSLLLPLYLHFPPLSPSSLPPPLIPSIPISLLFLHLSPPISSLPCLLHFLPSSFLYHSLPFSSHSLISLSLHPYLSPLFFPLSLPLCLSLSVSLSVPLCICLSLFPVYASFFSPSFFLSPLILPPPLLFSSFSFCIHHPICLFASLPLSPLSTYTQECQEPDSGFPLGKYVLLMPCSIFLATTGLSVFKNTFSVAHSHL